MDDSLVLGLTAQRDWGGRSEQGNGVHIADESVGNSCDIIGQWLGWPVWSTSEGWVRCRSRPCTPTSPTDCGPSASVDGRRLGTCPQSFSCTTDRRHQSASPDCPPPPTTTQDPLQRSGYNAAAQRLQAQDDRPVPRGPKAPPPPAAGTGVTHRRPGGAPRARGRRA